MKHIIEIERTADEPSRIVIGEVIEQLHDYMPKCKVVMITDSNLHRRYPELVEKFEYIIIGLGETNKTLVTIDRIYRELIELGADRECFIIGFGGGIVTDITGFVASTYMRGVRFGFIASSLLAQVDASVGGKNGVNMDGYKNMVGTFNQPDFVLCETSLLTTLPDREFRSGLAEIIKAGIIADSSLFELFEKHSAEEFRENKELLCEAITRAVQVKADIVGRDERETGERRKLNLGHTFAHAIEKSTDDYLHGEAVAIGLLVSAQIALNRGVLAEEDKERVDRVLDKFEFPLDLNIDMKQVMRALRHDKKSISEGINLVLPTAIGGCVVELIDFDALDGYIEALTHNVSSLHQSL